jgi:hypothetical protein
MDQFARGLMCLLLVAAAGLVAGCGSGASELLTSAAADAPATLNNDDPSARPIAVAWTSARAERCGFYFDPAKLRSSYLAFEAKQSGTEQLVNVQKTYDSTFQTIRQRVGAEAEYCTDAKSAEIKKDLARHLAGDFRPSFPKPKVVESCGFFGCGAPPSEEKFDSDRFWQDQERRRAY